MQAIIDSSTVTSLQKQIGKYTSQGPFCIGLEGEHELYKGISDYDNGHMQQVHDYKSTYKKEDSFEEDSFEEDSFLESTDPQFFRKKFIEYIQMYSFPEYDGDPETRTTHPEEATISMSKFLGVQGLELFQLALEEEMYSKEFREAVVIQSTSHFEGPKWEERPVVIVAGPSGSGKSYAAKAAVEKANQLLSVSSDLSGNYVMAADGGIIREVSQMRKLAIQLANNQGFTGIKDLHDQCKILDKVKKRMRKAAFLTPDLGVVIPETFSKWRDPRSNIQSLMKKIDMLDNTKQIFTRVEGHDPDNFRKVVAFMGSRRAWKTKDFDLQDFDLNKTGLSESKEYNQFGFSFGESGSKAAEAWFMAHSKDKLHMIITNDLILLKPDSAQPGNWVAATQDDEGARLFPENLYKQWEQLQHKPDLIDYCKLNSKTQIATSAHLDFAIAKNIVLERIGACHKKIEKTIKQEPPDEERLHYLQARLDLLETLAQFPAESLGSYDEIQKMQRDVDNRVLIIKEQLGDNWSRVFTKKTDRALNEFRAALDKATYAIENTPIYYVSLSDTSSNFKNKYNEVINKDSVEEATDQDKEGTGACPTS
ncbi:hypothetical protein FOLKNPGA_03002 [Legionella sp. PC1000]|uniref:hypothetical protein n=1 Tax=Legionella sp. PC1000 TaxID=2746060 RepID=UPI0015F8E6EB|nr:hypothetical protein [Legionella sp. PC1000]QLZ70197.1 hypothetical protein FOLKNPGA_03002 [Legionella sp. PC1000]